MDGPLSSPPDGIPLGMGGEVIIRSQREFEPASESIGAARDHVDDSLAASTVAESTAADIRLAVSELVTNAIVHGSGGPITVSVDTSPQSIVCSVASVFVGRSLPDPSTWNLQTGGERIGGRGLAIVRAVADAVNVETDGSLVTVQCTFARR